MEHRTFRNMWGDRALVATAQLTDAQIRVAIEELGTLIVRNEFYRPEDAKYASYEVHASDEVGEADYRGSRDGVRESRRHANPICISPGSTVRLFSQECFDLPPDVYATVIGMGQLYATGLTVGSTYVDPGTRATIYLSVSNVSQREVLVEVGAPIGRVQFYVLGAPAEQLHLAPPRSINRYRAGKTARPVASVASLEDLKAELRTVREQVAALPAQHAGAGLAEVRSGDNAVAKEQEDSRRVEAHSLALYFLTAAVVYPLLPEQFWVILNGEGLPAAARFFVVAVAGGGAFWLIVQLGIRSARLLRDRDPSGPTAP